MSSVLQITAGFIWSLPGEKSLIDSICFQGRLGLQQSDDSLADDVKFEDIIKVLSSLVNIATLHGTGVLPITHNVVMVPDK